MSTTLTGGCHCGAVRYEADFDKLEAYYCHCRMCQLSFGNIFATFTNLPKSSVRWLTRAPDYFISSRIARRGFCAACGTPLTFEYHDAERMDLSVGSLDEPGRLKPIAHFSVETRIPSFHVPDGLKEERLDSFEPTQRRWREAYGPDVVPGPRPPQDQRAPSTSHNPP
jgi:hypothetical protein